MQFFEKCFLKSLERSLQNVNSALAQQLAYPMGLVFSKLASLLSRYTTGITKATVCLKKPLSFEVKQ